MDRSTINRILCHRFDHHDLLFKKSGTLAVIVNFFISAIDLFVAYLGETFCELEQEKTRFIQTPLYKSTFECASPQFQKSSACQGSYLK